MATLLPIPRRYAAKGVERYGFHGLSYAYLMEELGRLDPAATKGGVILAHLSRLLSSGGLVAAQQGGLYDEPNWRMDGWMGGRRDVALDGDRRTGGGPAGRRDYQDVE
jgi:hypothetical protein